ncbi:uncharacterized protein LOC127452739 isoform X2 [Myxocyprinus asiaticus]|uniref:uncharacterized protein LOC127452739 isoform X2 n=1 Tax=Myxocyprinus asiaticus TaxID=70543 RepID=UPI002222024D|nr:uncharacterized protein LOC127452739 isoform X2 [Myxocyprinus asiaticus]
MECSVKMVDEENNVLLSTKNFNIGQRNGVDQTQTKSPPFPDLNLSSTPPVPQDWIVIPPPDCFQDANNYTPNVCQTTPTSGNWDQETDIFQPSNGKVHTDLQHSAPANQNTECSSSSNQKDYFMEFILSRHNDLQATTSPTSPLNSGDIFQETPTMTASSFETNSTTDNLHQSLPSTSPYSSNTTPMSNDIFKMPSSITRNKVFQSTPSVQTPTLMSFDTKAFDPLLDTSTKPQNDVQPKHSEIDYDTLLTSPKLDIHISPMGLQNGTVQGIPAVEASSSNTSPRLTFRRHQPKPAPRSRALKTTNHTTTSMQTLLANIPPTPTPSSFASIQDKTPASENDLPVYEDVLLLGQEKCVEDWPENSPELSPEWKPAGTLKLRRYSILIADVSDGPTGTDVTAKKNGKLTVGKKQSFLKRRSSKDKIGDEPKASELNTLGRGSKLNGDGANAVFSSDKEQNEYKSKKSSKPKIINMRRGSKVKSIEGSAKGTNSSAQESKEDIMSSLKNADIRICGEEGKEKDSKPKFKPLVPRRPSKSFSKDPSLDGNFEIDTSFSTSPSERDQGPEIDKHPEEKNSEEMDGQKQKKKVKVKFVPQRGYVIGLSKESDDSELKGACGYIPNPDFKENDRLDELKGACGYTPHSEFKEDTLLKTEAGHSYSPGDFKSSYFSGFVRSPSWDSKAAKHEKDFNKGTDVITCLDGNEKHQEMQDCRPKPIKFKFPSLHRRKSKSNEVAEVKQLATRDHDASALKKTSIFQVPPMPQQDSKSTEDEDEVPQKGADLFKAGDHEFSEDAGWEEYTLDNKPQKSNKMSKHGKWSKNKDVMDFPKDLLPPGATSGDFYLSEAAKAEWMSAQMDMRRAKEQEEDQRLEDGEDEGDTDSLMEWWNTVEFWDELPSDENISFKEDETISFKAIADKVHRGLRVYLKLFMERAELLYQHVLILYAIAEDLSNFHHRAKIANITGGTTTAVGGAAAIAGLALVPVTFGASLVISAIGLGVATAGGITAASATISDKFNNMHDRKKIEIIIQDYEAQLVEMQHCLQFITEGLRRLRSHPLLRRNNYFIADWEVRRALQTISFVSDPVERAEEITNNTMAKLASLHKGMDKYFTKDSKEVKKGCKKEVTAEVKSLAKNLQEGLVELNSIREQLLDACGNI